MHRTATVLAVALPLLFASGARAMYCQDRIIDDGDSAARVRSLCGEPTSITQRVVSRARAVHRRVGDVVVTDVIAVEVVVELWLYDLGPERLVRELTFESGRVCAIRTLGYGSARAALVPHGPQWLFPRRRIA